MILPFSFLPWLSPSVFFFFDQSLSLFMLKLYFFYIKGNLVLSSGYRKKKKSENYFPNEKPKPLEDCTRLSLPPSLLDELRRGTQLPRGVKVRSLLENRSFGVARFTRKGKKFSHQLLFSYCLIIMRENTFKALLFVLFLGEIYCA